MMDFFYETDVYKVLNLLNNKNHFCQNMCFIVFSNQ